MSDVAELLIAGWLLNLKKAEELLADISADEMTRQPHGVVNHPAWTLAHLIHYHPAITSLARGQAVADPAAAPNANRYDAGSTPVDDPSLYLAKDALLARYRSGHAEVTKLLETAPPERLLQPPGLPRWEQAFTTTRHALVYLMHYHESLHIGQIMVWRRAMGRPPLE